MFIACPFCIIIDIFTENHFPILGLIGLEWNTTTTKKKISSRKKAARQFRLLRMRGRIRSLLDKTIATSGKMRRRASTISTDTGVAMVLVAKDLFLVLSAIALR